MGKASYYRQLFEHHDGLTRVPTLCRQIAARRKALDCQRRAIRISHETLSIVRKECRCIEHVHQVMAEVNLRIARKSLLK